MIRFLKKPDVNLDDIHRLTEKIGFIDKIHDNEYVDWVKYDIVIIGLSNNNDFKSVDVIRQQFYDLYSFQNLKIFDLGNLNYNIDNEQLISEVNLLLKTLTDVDIKIIYIAENGNSNILFYNFFENFKQNFSNLIVSPFLPYDEFNSLSYNSNNFLNYFNLFSKYITKNNVIGLQNYLVSGNVLAKFKNSVNQSFRLSEVQADFLDFEPEFRNANIVALNSSSAKFLEVPGGQNPQPNGFSSFEICKLSNYAGLSDELNFFGFYDYTINNDIHFVGAKLIAQAFWHFLDAFSRKKELNNLKTLKYSTFYLKVDNNNDLKFKHCEKTDRWWAVKIENLTEKMLPCSFKDYSLAKSGNLTKRISLFLNH
ncbi:MAG: hypothetical protein JXR68_07345 [Bacteroidales bacterium]|nr:hypothetical protein [Bacteroidales bacterium]